MPPHPIQVGWAHYALLSLLSRAFSAYITQLVTQLLQGSGGSSSSLIAIPALETTLPDTASLTVDWRTSAQQMATLTGPRTITFVNVTPGQLLRLVLCQDQTGSRTVTWPASVTWSGSAAPALSTGSGRCDVVSFIGTNAKGTIKALGTLAPNF